MSISNLEQARRKLAAAQANVAALERLPEVDDFEVGHMIRWCRGDGTPWKVAIKERPQWWCMSGRESLAPWSYVLACAKGHDVVEVCEDDAWHNLLTDPPPPVEVNTGDESGNLTITYGGRTWRYSDTVVPGWVRV